MGRDEQPETPVSWFHTRATHYVEAQMLFHLSQAGVMTELYRGPATAETIAERLQLDTEILRTLLDYVVGIDNLLRLNQRCEYVLTDFGHQVFKRFSKNDSMEEFNFFDVRVGCFGPVWKHIGEMVSGRAVYGKDFQRDGAFAAQGVSKLSRHLIKPIDRAVTKTGARRLAIVGVTPGLVEVIGRHHPDAVLTGLDRDPEALADLDASIASGIAIERLHADFFKPCDWAAQVRDADPADTGLFISIHFHEFMARGHQALRQLMADLREHFPGWHVLALEQDRLLESARAETPDTLWLYAHSNVLIHHLIGNAKVLTRDQWIDILSSNGATLVDIFSAEYLGYNGYLVAL